MIDLWRIGSEAEGHAALLAILRRYTDVPLQFARAEKGKPYLPGVPTVHFNLARSHGRGLIAVSREIEVGVDLECLRPLPNLAAMVERFFPPGEDAPGDEREFFQRWTRMEALLKALGDGLFATGAPADGEWSVQDIDAGEGFAAAVAGRAPRLTVNIYDFGVNS